MANFLKSDAVFNIFRKRCSVYSVYADFSSITYRDGICFPIRICTQAKVTTDSNYFLKCQNCTQPVKDLIVFGSLSLQFYHRDYDRHYNFPHLCFSECISFLSYSQLVLMRHYRDLPWHLIQLSSIHLQSFTCCSDYNVPLVVCFIYLPVLIAVAMQILNQKVTTLCRDAVKALTHHTHRAKVMGNTKRSLVCQWISKLRL